MKRKEALHSKNLKITLLIKFGRYCSIQIQNFIQQMFVSSFISLLDKIFGKAKAFLRVFYRSLLYVDSEESYFHQNRKTPS